MRKSAWSIRRVNIGIPIGPGLAAVLLIDRLKLRLAWNSGYIIR